MERKVCLLILDGAGYSTAERGNEQWLFLALGLVAAIAMTTVITRIARKALDAATGTATAPTTDSTGEAK